MDLFLPYRHNFGSPQQVTRQSFRQTWETKIWFLSMDKMENCYLVRFHTYFVPGTTYLVYVKGL